MHELGWQEVTIRFLVALVLSGAIGLERERKGRAAGLRTHVMVCFGATLMMVVGSALAVSLDTAGASIRFDTSRIAAGIITGVGFLGAGTIINYGAMQRGLTTAAMIWFSAALGVAVGAGYYMIGTLAAALALVSMLLLEYLERFVAATRHFVLDLRTSDSLHAVEGIEAAIRDEGFRVVKSGVKISSEKQQTALTYEITTRKQANIERLARRLQEEFPAISRLDIER